MSSKPLSSILLHGNYSIREDDSFVEFVSGPVTVSTTVVDVTWLNDEMPFAQPVSALLAGGCYSLDENGTYVTFNSDAVMVELEIID